MHRHHLKLTWVLVTMVASGGAETIARAQSAPVRAVGTAASAAPKKTDTGAPVDLGSLATREEAAGRSVARGLALPGSAGAPIQAAGGAGTLQTLHGDATGATSTTAGRVAPIVPVDDAPRAAATAAPPPHAEAVIRGQINPAARTCYDSEPDAKAKQAGRLILLIKLAPTGDVDSVDVAANTGLSPSVTACITTAARAARFAAPGGNGATVRAALALGKQDEAPAPAASRGKAAPAASSTPRVTQNSVAKAEVPAAAR